MKHLFLAILLLLPVTAFSQHGHAPAKEPAPVVLTPGLGDINHPVSTSNAEAQKFFNQGLAYLYGFNHEEAIRSFQQAAKLDPQLAMAYWGTSLALGSNYNVQAEGPALVQAYTNLQKAIELAPKASEPERASGRRGELRGTQVHDRGSGGGPGFARARHDARRIGAWYPAVALCRRRQQQLARTLADGGRDAKARLSRRDRRGRVRADRRRARARAQSQRADQR